MAEGKPLDADPGGELENTLGRFQSQNYGLKARKMSPA